MVHKSRGAVSLVFITMGILAIVFILAFAFFFRLRQTGRQMARLLNGEITSFIAEAAINEAFAHVRDDANKDGSWWYTALRRDLAECQNTPPTETFNPQKTLSLVEREYGTAPDLDVQIRFENVSVFPDDPCSQLVEKMGTLRITARVVYKGIRKTIYTLRDVKVVNIDIPEPVAGYKFWSFDLGSLRLSAESLLQNFLPLEDSEKTTIVDNWRFTWDGKQMRNFPLCKRKISYFFWSVADFELFTYRYHPILSRLYHQLEGLSVLNEPRRFNDAIFKGDGNLLTCFPLVLQRVSIPEFSTISFTVLGTGRMQVLGHRDDPLRASLNVPDGELVLQRGTSVKGRIFARTCKLPDLEGRLESDVSSASPAYHVTVSEQITLWNSL